MFAVETGPSREAKDLDPPHPARWAPHPPQLRPMGPLPPNPELLASETPPLLGSGPLNQTSPPLPRLFKMDESNQPKMRQSRGATKPTGDRGLRPSASGHWRLLPDARSSLVCLNHHVPQAPPLSLIGPPPRFGPVSQDTLRMHSRKTKMVATRPAPPGFYSGVADSSWVASWND